MKFGVAPGTAARAIANALSGVIVRWPGVGVTCIFGQPRGCERLIRYKNGVVSCAKEITSPATTNSRTSARDTIPKLLCKSNHNFAVPALPEIPNCLAGHHKYTPDISKNSAANADHLTDISPNLRPLSSRASRM